MERRRILMNFEVTTGVIAKAQKVVIYGPEGIGKSSLAAQLPNPVFVDTEGSTNNMNVARLTKPTSWTMLLQEIDYVLQTHQYSTFVIDTIDWAERLAIQHICEVAQKKSIEDFSYGSGYIKLEEEIGRFLNRLQDVVDQGINVVLTAHSQIVKFEQPDEMGAYDRYTLKLGKKTQARTSALVKEWADMVLFCNYETFAVQNDNKKNKAQGGKRVIHTTHAPTWDAKNRFGLPDVIDMDYKNIAHIFAVQQSEPQPTQQPQVQAEPANTTSEPVTTIETSAEDVNSVLGDPLANELPADFDGVPQALADLMTAAGVTAEEVAKAVEQRGYYPIGTPIANYDPQFVQGVLIGAWQSVLQTIMDNRKGE